VAITTLPAPARSRLEHQRGPAPAANTLCRSRHPPRDVLLIEPEEQNGNYWTKVSVDTFVLMEPGRLVSFCCPDTIVQLCLAPVYDLIGPSLGRTMMRNDQPAVLLPMVIGSIVVLCTIFIHSVTLGATVRFFRRQMRLGRVGPMVSMNLGIFVMAMSFAFVAHLIEIALWAVFFVICGEFRSLALAFYHSAVNYTTLGYGDLIMSPSWKLLGPLEAADGALMFGVSTAMIFAVAQRLMHAKFEDF
jgi:hypothetical protein